jgi:hypothetical protein
LLALGPGLRPGFLLSYDMVFVPRPPFSAALLGVTGGPPRAVPSDAVVTVLSRVAPADLVQKLILILIFMLACSGAAALLASGWRRARGADPPVLAALAAGVCFAWNPFVAERLLIGQWALLLGYAGLPWVCRALLIRRDKVAAGPLCAALLPAAAGGFGAMGVTALAALPVSWLSGEPASRTRRTLTVLLVLVVFSLPWLVPSMLVPVHTDPRGADAFVARADTPFGRLGSLLLLGGIWNAQTVPSGYGGAPSVIWLLVVLAALAAYALLARPSWLAPGLGVAGLAGLVIALIGVTSPGRAVLRDLIGFWPGFAVLRDGQEYLAPLALAEATGLGAAVAWLHDSAAGQLITARTGRGWPARLGGGRAPMAEDASRRPWPDRAADTASPAGSGTGGAGRAPGRRAAAALGVMAVLAPVLLLPGLAWGEAGRLRPAEYPSDWIHAARLIGADPRPGSALVLPWAAYRSYPWNGGEGSYDPWPQLLGREVILNDELQVGSLTLAAESRDSIRLGAIVRRGGPLTSRLAAAGVRYVIVDAGPLLTGRRADLSDRAALPGATVLLASSDLVVFQLPASR